MNQVISSMCARERLMVAAVPAQCQDTARGQPVESSFYVGIAPAAPRDSAAAGILPPRRDRETPAADRSSRPEFSSAHGLRCKPSCVQVQASNSSSIVPMPPGSARNASDEIAHEELALRHRAHDVQLRQAGMPDFAVDQHLRNHADDAPPAASAASASAPISPTRPPPYTSVSPRRAISSPVRTRERGVCGPVAWAGPAKDTQGFH